MSGEWREWLARWSDAGLIDPATAERIREFEGHHAGSTRLRWPVLIALAFGALMLAGGVLLFIAAHWDLLSPAQRFAIVLTLVAGFHVAGAFMAERFDGMSSALHAIGTVSLGAGIALAGQIFNLEEHWPAGIMWWAIGAATGWFVLRQLPQLVLLAALAPAWLVSEWTAALPGFPGPSSAREPACGIFLLALTYFTAPAGARMTDRRRALMWLGGIAVIPAAAAFALTASEASSFANFNRVPRTMSLIGWTIALAAPLILGFLLRGTAAWPIAIAALWALALVWIKPLFGTVMLYAWWAIGATGLVAWGVREGRSERVNIGAVLFAATVITFYFSEVMNKLGRSASLVGLGLLFLAGGWALERARRRLVQQAKGIA